MSLFGRTLHILLLAHLAFVPPGSGFLHAQLSQEDVRQSLGTFSHADMATTIQEAATFEKYPTYGQYLELMKGFAREHPELCRLDTFGYSIQDRPLLALHITSSELPNEGKARFLYTSTMHGDEIAGMVLLLRLADTLLSAYGSDPEIDHLLNELQISINPLANPDGAYDGDADTSLLNSIRFNLEGTDLNRDFPDPAISEPDSLEGRSVETQHMMRFLRKHRFTLSANIHGGVEVVNYPWDHSYDRHADDEWYRFISHEYADEAMATDPDYMFGWPERGITHGADWYPAFGTRQDYVNYYLQGREVTLELHTDKRLPSEELSWLWEINYRPLINYMAQATYGIRGRVSELDNNNILEASIHIPGHDQAYSHVSSSAGSGYFHRLLAAGFYDLVASAPGYLDDTLRDVRVYDHQRTELSFSLARDPKAGSREAEAPRLRIWPNPARGTFMLSIDPLIQTGGRIAVYDMKGRQHFSAPLAQGQEELRIETTGWTPGLYLVHLAGSDFALTETLLLLKE